MLKVIIKCDSWIARIAATKLRHKSVAIVLGNTIHLHNTSRDVFTSNKRWLRHELKHVDQFRQYGFIRFLFLYLFESLKKGYHKNKYEVEARNAETDDTLLEKYDVSCC